MAFTQCWYHQRGVRLSQYFQNMDLRFFLFYVFINNKQAIVMYCVCVMCFLEGNYKISNYLEGVFTFRSFGNPSVVINLGACISKLVGDDHQILIAYSSFFHYVLFVFYKCISSFYSGILSHTSKQNTQILLFEIFIVTFSSSVIYIIIAFCE